MNTDLDHSFCFWDSQTQLDTYIMIFDTCVGAVLLGLIIKAYMKARKVLKSGRLKFYRLMILWGIGKHVDEVVFIGKNLFGILVFLFDYWPNRTDL